MIQYQLYFKPDSYTTVAKPEKLFFERGYYIINGKEYRKYNEEFIKEYEKALFWELLKNECIRI